MKSFARIHRANLVNFGILPLIFVNPADYDRLRQGMHLTLPDVQKRLCAGEPLELIAGGPASSRAGQEERLLIPVRANLSPREVEVVLAGGLLNTMRGAKK